MNTTIDLLLNHRSVRNYHEKSVSEDVKEKIIRCAQMAPTSSYFQAYTIIELEDIEKKKTCQGCRRSGLGGKGSPGSAVLR